MDKMIYAFDEEKARKDGRNPEDFYLDIERALKKLRGNYRKEINTDGTVTYIGDDPSCDWWNICSCMHIHGMHSEYMAKYCTKWLWDYDDGEDLAEDDLYEEDLLEHNIRKNELFQRYHRC